MEPQVKMPITMKTIKKAIELGLVASMERRKRENRNIAKSFKKNFYFFNFNNFADQGIILKGDPLLAYAKMMRPKPEAIHASKLAHVLLEATKLIYFRLFF